MILIRALKYKSDLSLSPYWYIPSDRTSAIAFTNLSLVLCVLEERRSVKSLILNVLFWHFLPLSNLSIKLCIVKSEPKSIIDLLLNIFVSSIVVLLLNWPLGAIHNIERGITSLFLINILAIAVALNNPR